MNILPFRPGQEVELRGMKFKIAATNHEGKLILHPIGLKESAVDMMTRLQSTTSDPSSVRAEFKAPPSPPPVPGLRP